MVLRRRPRKILRKHGLTRRSHKTSKLLRFGSNPRCTSGMVMSPRPGALQKSTQSLLPRLRLAAPPISPTDQVFARSVTTKHSLLRAKRPMLGHGTSCSTTVDGSSHLISPLGHAAETAPSSQSIPMVDFGSLFLIPIRASPTGSIPQGFATHWLPTDLFEPRHRQSHRVAS